MLLLRIALISAAAAVCLLLTACERAQAGAGKQPIEITYWTGWSGHELEIQRQLVSRFEQLNPDVRVRIMTVAGSYEKVAISFAAGNPPDLMSSVWLDDLASYAMRGVLHPLDEYLNKSGRNVDREYVPAIARAVQYNGHVWGMMITTGAQFVLANEKTLRDAGVDPSKPPATLAEFDQINDKLAKFDASGNLVRFGWRPGDLVLWGHLFGGEWYDPKTRKVTAAHPRNVEALSHMTSYGKKYDPRKLAAFESLLSGSNMGYVSDTGNFASIFSGYSGMLFTGDYSAEFIARYAPKDFRYTMFPLPAPEGGRPGAFAIGGSVFVIPRDARHPEAAWRFLNYLSSPEAMKEFCLKIRNMPPLKSLLEDPDFNKTEMQKFASELLVSENVFGPSSMPLWSYYTSQLARAQQRALLGGENPKSLLDEVQATVQTALDKALQHAVY